MASILTYEGERWVLDRVGGVGAHSTYVNLYCGWGTGAGTAAKGDTTLFTESTDPGSANRVSAAPTELTNAQLSLYKWQEVVTLSSTSTQTITNAGLFSGSGAATLFIKGDFTGIGLSSGDSIQFTFTLDPG